MCVYVRMRACVEVEDPNNKRVEISVCVCSGAQLCLTLCDPPWTVVCQAPLSMEFPRQEYWNGFSFPIPGESS